MTVDTYLHRGRRFFTRLKSDQRARAGMRILLWAGSGFVLSAGGLSHRALPFAMSLVSIATGWRCLVMGLGSGLGYWHFWADAGLQGVMWTALAMMTALAIGKSRLPRQSPFLLPAFSTLWVAATGLVFQFWGRNTPTLVYILRMCLAWAGTQLFQALKQKREPILLWCAQAIAVLALTQLPEILHLNFGVLTAGCLAAGGAFPGAVLAGVALDLSIPGPVSMTAVIAAVCLVRMLPGIPRRANILTPALVYFLVAALSGVRGLSLLPSLALGGITSLALPGPTEPARRRGPTGIAQVRLELMAQVLDQTRGLLLETEDTPIDEEALLSRTRDRACGSCPNRRTCHSPDQIPRELLRRPLTENTALPFFCKKPGRMVLEIRRTQEQYRLMKADRDRRREYRGAVREQYAFLSDFLREQADILPRRSKPYRCRFAPEVASCAKSREKENGDRFRHFSGPGGQYFLLLCDGMGTGLGAAEEGKSAAALLQGMLTAGFPPEHALRSLNSLLALRGRAGAVTVDLAALSLETGAGVVYKWGAAPSYLLRRNTAEKIGTAGPPPGIRGSDVRAQQIRLSLRRGETLIILSDGVDGEGVRRLAVTGQTGPLGERAAQLLEAGAESFSDDATLALLRLRPTGMLT